MWRSSGNFFHRLPSQRSAAQERDRDEQMLGEMAAQLRPDQLQQAADRMAALINPDGTFSDLDRARKRGFSWGAQGCDGMSQGTLIADPQLRATLDAVIAKLGAPGMCNPEDPTPTVDGAPPEESVRADTRTRAQRAHDALTAMGRSVWPPASWASTAGCRPPSSCAPPCKNCSQGWARPTPAAAAGCRCAT